MRNRSIMTRYYDENGQGGSCGFGPDEIAHAFMNAAVAVQSDGFTRATITIPNEGEFTLTFKTEAECKGK